jgi:peptide/nickel transport system permease protein
MSTVWLAGTSPGDLLRHLLLPTLSLALVAAGVIGRIARAAAIDVLAADHIRLCRARGIAEPRILLVHALKAVLARSMPVIGLQAGFLIGGAVYIETIFQWPGLGRMLVDAIAARDLLLVQGGVLLLATAYVLVNLAADLLQHGWIDARARPDAGSDSRPSGPWCDACSACRRAGRFGCSRWCCCRRWRHRCCRWPTRR